MPRDLFGDVTRPSISIGNRKWYTVPVSLLSHAIVIAMIVVLPILAAPLMPGVLDNNTLETFIEMVPPDPPPRNDDPPKPIADPNLAPLTAPDTITPEPATPPEPFEATRPGVVIVGGDDVGHVLAPPPAVAPPPPAPVRVGGAIRQPVRVRAVDPVYPAIAQAARVQGIVIIEATIDADGRISNTRVLRSIPLLDEAALQAVRQWEYTPTLLNGMPVPVIMTVTVSFTLSR